MKHIIYASLVVVLAGCTTSPRSGTVGWESTFSVGSFAPDIPYTAANGSKTTFNKVREPIAILAFTSTPENMCCSVNPSLVNLVNDFENLSVTVAQVSVPVGKCHHGKGCTEVCSLGKTQLISLCDRDRIAWNAYQQPKPNTVFLIDANNTIQEIGSFENIDQIAQKAKQMASQKLPKTRKDVY